ncbi:DNA polymerase III subunit delta' [Alkalilimnicola ehrlichii MLHE-1]|uniref:DNA polymerase III subunit delta' n=1 Tax=Alkalilimnicola ehrlichii (strain ATCC BAA-1101 / DSM 17681 / MLHE-1) TaxID=187272 RepID=Q0A8S3_ALKEH|nr:DNA polymerase III subunit delta' [Alkalilimnicola ehrlichii]ABI56764.1 DNA polymerase III, delta prime subunit [Alkalilimnicola ehrlichii MLHE-1]
MADTPASELAEPAWTPPTGSVPEWLDDRLSELLRQAASGQLPHALLLAGPAGTGKSLLGGHLVRALLCHQPGEGGRACGRCESCRALARGLHPDFRHLAPEERAVITVDAVRALGRFLNLSARFGGWRIALIDPADTLTVNAANSLLKTLEEPPATTLLVLVSSRPAQLPATIRSRCRHLTIPVPPAERALSGLRGQGLTVTERTLALAGGAPFRGLAWEEAGLPERLDRLAADLLALHQGRQDPIALARDWADLDLPVFLDVLATLLAELARFQAGGAEASRAAPAAPLRALAAETTPTAVLGHLEAVHEAQYRQGHPLNPQLVRESLLVGWLEAV